MAPTGTIEVGDVLDGKYEITGVLGQGAMGVVYKAFHKRLHRPVALKTLQAGFAENAEILARFEREARASSAIGHANIVQIFDAGDTPLPYLVMEQLEGQNLGELLGSARTLELGRAVDLIRQCLNGLGAAHRAGIIHRDLKPDNIFITTDDRDGPTKGAELIKILDFGISKFISGTDPGDSKSTRAGMIMGTPYYMSPEQASGQGGIDHRTDLWAMACVFYECISGRPPFRGQNHTQTMTAVILGKFDPLGEVCPEIPFEISAVIDRALDPDVDKRYSDAESMAEALSNAAKAAPAQSSAGLDAFDNLADRFRAQEAEGQQEENWLAPPAVATPTPPETTPAPTPAPSQDERFAPPSANEPVSLALDVDISQTRRTPPPAEDDPRSDSRRKRRVSEWVTRDEPSRLGATLLKLLVLLLIIAGAGAGYRYYTLGYILPKEAPPMASLSVQVIPSDTRFLLDEQEQGSRTVEFEGGKEYQISLKADGYLGMRGSVAPEPGQSWSVQAELGHLVPKIDVSAIGSPLGNGEDFRSMSPADVRVGYEKLAALSACGARLSKALESALPHATETEEEPKPVAYNLMDECGVKIEVFAAKEPMLPPLDSTSRRLVRKVRELNQALRDQGSSTGASAKVQRETRAAVERTSGAARKTRDRWLQDANRTSAHWLATDALRVRGLDGEGMHVPLRDLIVASDLWVRAHRVGAKASPQLHESLKKAYGRAQSDSEARPAHYEQSGAGAFLRAMKPLTEFKPTDEVVFFHNQAVDLFNRIQLPLTVRSQGTPGTRSH